MTFETLLTSDRWLLLLLRLRALPSSPLLLLLKLLPLLPPPNSYLYTYSHSGDRWCTEQCLDCEIHCALRSTDN